MPASVPPPNTPPQGGREKGSVRHRQDDLANVLAAIDAAMRLDRLLERHELVDDRLVTALIDNRPDRLLDAARQLRLEGGRAGARRRAGEDEPLLDDLAEIDRRLRAGEGGDHHDPPLLRRG